MDYPYEPQLSHREHDLCGFWCCCEGGFSVGSSARPDEDALRGRDRGLLVLLQLLVDRVEPAALHREDHVHG